MQKRTGKLGICEIHPGPPESILTASKYSTMLIINDADNQQRLINWMDNTTWSVETLADELLRVLPNLGHLIALHMREANEEETTLMQVGVLYHLQERGSITASELAKRRKVSLQSVSVLVQGMVEKGW